MNIDEKTIERLRDQIRKQGFIDIMSLSAHICFFADETDEYFSGAVILNYEELDAIACDDIVYVTDGVAEGYSWVDSDFYQKNVAPNEAAAAYKKALHEAERAERAKLPWWKRILRMK